MDSSQHPRSHEADRPTVLPEGDAERRAHRYERRRARREQTHRRILRTTAILPSLFTVSNGLLGFAAIHLATRQGIDAQPAMLGTAAWLLFAAMVCDMLDGRLARMTRRTSDFGAQLDSLCDAISFGLAPAVLMVRAVMSTVHGEIGKVAFMARFSDIGIERILWCIGGVYVAGAIMRLARFNVENEPDESAHMEFRGLPTPGAAAAVATLVLLLDHLKSIDSGGWLFGPWLLASKDALTVWMCAAMSIILPLITLAVGLLMVSRFRYPHVVNQYFRGKRPFSYLVKAVVIVLAALLEPFVALAAAAMVYALSAPVLAAWRRLRHHPATDNANTSPAPDAPAEKP